MATSTLKEEAVASYSQALDDLKASTKPVINGLTMMAEDYKDVAVSIVGCIEKHLNEAPSPRKLPFLYLIDSICINFPKSIYVELFRQNIVSNFCNVFRASNENTRRSLYKLRCTWEQNKVFLPKKLAAIDDRVREIDPAWPVQPIKQQQHQTPPQLIKASKETKEFQATNNQSNPARRKRQRTSNNKDKSAPSGNAATSRMNLNPNIPIPELMQEHMQPHANPHVFALGPTLNDGMPTTYGMNPDIMNQPQNMVATIHNQQQLMMGTQMSSMPMQYQMDYLSQGMMLQTNQQHLQNVQLPMQPMDFAPCQVQNPQQQFLVANQAQGATLQMTMPLQMPIQAPTIITQNQTFAPQPFPSTQKSVVDSLYGGKQCTNCSLRFDDKARYANHLDWHFRENSKSDNTLVRRKWFYPLHLWIQFREIHDGDPQEDENNDNSDGVLPSADDDAPTAPASKDDEKNICSVCHESFEKFWSEDEEEWRLMKAKLHTDERVYHPLCLSDMLKANSD